MFSIFQNIRTDPGAHATPLFNKYRGYFLVTMRLGLEVDRLPLSSAELENEWSYNFRPSISLYDVHKEDTPLALTV
jgi:hypothetical protein